MPATTISQMKHDARLVSPMMPAVKASSSTPSSGRMKKIRKICTRNGVPRVKSTQAPITPLSVRLSPALSTPKAKPISVPNARLISDSTAVMPRPRSASG